MMTSMRGDELLFHEMAEIISEGGALVVVDVVRVVNNSGQE